MEKEKGAIQKAISFEGVNDLIGEDLISAVNNLIKMVILFG